MLRRLSVTSSVEAVGDVVRVVEAALLVVHVVAAAVQRTVEIVDGRAHPGRFLVGTLAVQLLLEAVAFMDVPELFQLDLDLLQPLPQLKVLLFQLLAGFPVQLQLYARCGRKRGKEEEGRA